MSINSISGASRIYQSQQTNNSSSIRKDFQDLGSALNSGNITDAQSAFATILQTIQGNGGNSGSSNSQLSADFQSLQSALNSGDITSAQKVYATIQKDMKGVHGHHHHHKDGDQNSSSSSTDSSNTMQNSFQTLIAGLGNLQSALTSGSSTDAQNAFNILQNNNSTTDILSGNSQASQVLQTLQTALGSGDVNSAQNSYSALMQSIQNMFNGNATGNIIDALS